MLNIQTTEVLLSSLISALVVDKTDVTISTSQEPQRVVFQVHVSASDLGKVIGKQGRTAQSLRHILSCIGKTDGNQYALVLD